MYRLVKAGEVFTTFIFDGKDCADMGVYSTTSSGTYTMYIEPTFKDEMLEVPAYDGRYYYGTQYTAQQFQFNLFADNLSLTEYRNLKTWLKPRNIGKLILSDQPYKYYTVKVTSISALGEYPLTDAQTVVHSVLGDMAEGNVVYTGRFTVTFQTVGSVYGYGLSYYRDDLLYDALDHYGVDVYPENYYYDSGLLYKDMAPALTRTIPANANNFDLTIYNPGSATAIPNVYIDSVESYGDKKWIQFDNNTLNTSTVVDVSNLTGPLMLDMESETITTTDDDGNTIKHYGRFSGNPFEIGEETSVITIPESFTETIESFYVRDYDSVYVINDTKGKTWAHINPLIMKVTPSLIGKYFCINGNGGSIITAIDDEENRVQLDDAILTYEVLPAEVNTAGDIVRPAGMEFRHVGFYESVEELEALESQPGDVATIYRMSINSKGQEIIDEIEMYLYRYDKWSKTNLFTSPAEFKDMYGNDIPRYLIFGANIVDVNDIKVSTNIGECEMSVSFLPRYL